MKAFICYITWMYNKLNKHNFNVMNVFTATLSVDPDTVT